MLAAVLAPSRACRLAYLPLLFAASHQAVMDAAQQVFSSPIPDITDGLADQVATALEIQCLS